MTIKKALFPISSLAFLLLVEFCLSAQCVFPTPLGAQELEFDFPPNYQFPVLSDSDFQVFLVVGENPGNVPRSYLDQNNVTEERLAGLLAKILANSAIKRGADPASIVKLYGDSVIFNPSEDALYEKYKDRINKVMEMLERLE